MTKEEEQMLKTYVQILACVTSFKMDVPMRGEENWYIKTWNSVYIGEDDFELVTRVDNKQVGSRLSYISVWQEIKKYRGIVSPETFMNVIMDDVTENANIIKSED